MFPFTRTQIKNFTFVLISLVHFMLSFVTIYHGTKLITEKLIHADSAKKITIYRCFSSLVNLDFGGFFKRVFVTLSHEENILYLFCSNTRPSKLNQLFDCFE